MKKKFSKKKRAPAEPRLNRYAPDSDFYSRRGMDSTLDGYVHDPTAGKSRLTSQHSPARRRENSNRASDWEIFKLLFRTGLIVVLLGGGYFALRMVLSRAAEPTEKEKQQWEEKAALMERREVRPAASSGLAAEALPVVDSELIMKRLERWETADRHLRSAEALSRRGIDDEAVGRLGQVLRSSPDNRAAQQLLLDLYMKKGLYAEAIPLCVRLLDQDSRDQELYGALLTALQATGQADAVLALAASILKEQPNNMTVLLAAATARLEQGDSDAAMELYRRMLALDSSSREALRGCGIIHTLRGEDAQAVPFYLELVRLAPQEEFYKALALAYSRLNEPGKSVVILGQAASLLGERSVAGWLKDVAFNPIRETVEFRSFADRVVGIETRKAIEALSRREAEKAKDAPGSGLDLPTQPDLQLLKSGK